MKNEIQEIFKTLKTKELTDSEAKFVKALRAFYWKHKTLSDRQMKVLNEIARYYETGEGKN